MGNDYVDKLKDPRWQKKRLQILERDEWCCQRCSDNESTLVVHHRDYISGKEPWDYPDLWLVTLCEKCHEEEKLLRPNIEAQLLQTLRLKFTVDGLASLSDGFAALNLCHAQEIVASAYEAALRDQKRQEGLIADLFKELHQQALNLKRGG